MSCLSGFCAACGHRVSHAEPCLYVPPGAAVRFLYLLCSTCRTEVESDGPQKLDVLRAVEQRCEHGRGARA